jgi:stearoyl-CoA desaturase (delta-9 desaturase)
VIQKATHEKAGERSTPSWLVALGRWFDSSIGDGDLAPEADRVDWPRVVPFLLLHLGCLGVLWVGWSPIAVAVATAAYFIRMFAITGFYHRYFSHRTFGTSRPAQFLFALLGNSSAQRGPLWWAAHHRHHHRHSDDEEDVHSPVHRGLLWSHMLWIMTKRNFPTRMKAVPDLSRYPELVFLDRFDILGPLVLAGALYGTGELLQAYVPALGTSGPQMLVWGFFISTVVLFHATCTINSLSHTFGSQRFRTGDQSRNNPVLALVTLGEGWHNNHHYYPGAVRQGFYWWEIDLTYYGLKLLSWLGIIRDLHPVPERVYRAAESATNPGTDL